MPLSASLIPLAAALQPGGAPVQSPPATEAVQPPPATQEPGWWPGQQPPADRPDEQTPDDQGRRRPGTPQHELPDSVVQENPGAIRSPPPEAFPTDQIPVPDRWRLIESLGVVRERWFDPYGQNTLKGDRPICVGEERPQSAGCRLHRALGLHGDDWFFAASIVSDTVVEPRTFPIPVGVQTTRRPGSLDVFGRSESLVLAQTFIVGAALIQGGTAYMPPHREYRVTLAVQANYVDVPERRVLFVEPSRGTNRFDYALGVQELFVDDHLRNVSDRFDFDSIRIGIQPFQFDFRGFLFNDNQLGVRLFGNRDNNRFQYNLMAVWRLEKDTNSGLNNILQWPRSDWILAANLFRQDFPFVGMTSQASLTWNINRERGDIEIDDNGFPVRPALIGTLRGRNYDVVYLGYGADGRIGRINLSAQAYAAFGWDRPSVFTGETAKIRSFFAAAEPSYDLNWIRLRGAALFASGDGDPFDDTHEGFDAIFENPIFAGADTSYWIRQTIPFAGGGRAIALSGRNGLLNSLRSSKEQGQSNFANPGTILVGAGADFDITPQIRVSANVNHLWFARTGTLEALRMQGTIRNDIGWDVSAAVIWRPQMTQNLVFRVSAAVLQPGTGFRDLFENQPRHDRYYSVLLNAIVTY